MSSANYLLPMSASVGTAYLSVDKSSLLSGTQRKNKEHFLIRNLSTHWSAVQFRSDASAIYIGITSSATIV